VMHRTTVGGDSPTVADGEVTVSPARPADVAWARTQVDGHTVA
jgi:hypothetical protein